MAGRGVIAGPILVTGATGFIGQRLVALLAAQGAEVTGWTRSLGDLTDAEAVARVVGDLAPGVIYHLAAGPAAPASDSWTVAAAEVAMVSNLAHAMPAGARLVHCGSMSEYGRSGTFAEDDLRQPRSLYGFGKAASVDHAVTLAATKGLDIRVARLFGVYGPGEAERRLVPYLVQHLLHGHKVPLRDGGQVRDFIHVDDVCACLMAFAGLPAWPDPVVNVGTGVGVTVAQVAHRVADLLGADPALLEFGTVPDRAIDESTLVANVGRLAAIARVPDQYWLGDSRQTQDYVVRCRDAMRGGT